MKTTDRAKLSRPSKQDTVRDRLNRLLVTADDSGGKAVPFRRERPSHVVAVRLTDSEFAMLEELKELVEEKTLSGVILEALAVYAELVAHLRQDRQIRIVEVDE